MVIPASANRILRFSPLVISVPLIAYPSHFLILAYFVILVFLIVIFIGLNEIVWMKLFYIHERLRRHDDADSRSNKISSVVHPDCYCWDNRKEMTQAFPLLSRIHMLLLTILILPFTNNLALTRCNDPLNKDPLTFNSYKISAWC